MSTFSAPPHTARGLSLIELVIVLAIIGILASIAYPGYQGHLRKTRCTEAKTLMLEVLGKEQNFYSRNLTYTTDLKDGLGYDADPLPTASGHHQITASACGAGFGGISDCVQLTATPLGGAAAAANNCTVSINSAGAKTPAEEW